MWAYLCLFCYKARWFYRLFYLTATVGNFCRFHIDPTKGHRLTALVLCLCGLLWLAVEMAILRDANAILVLHGEPQGFIRKGEIFLARGAGYALRALHSARSNRRGDVEVLCSCSELDRNTEEK